MSRRNWNPVAHFASPGLVFGAFGFVTTNIGTNPDVALMFGCGGLKGGDAAAGVANTGPAFVSSITKTANAGEYLVTLKDGYRAVWHASAELWGPTAGPAGGDSAQVCKPANQGSGHETPVTFLVTTLDNADTPVETAGRTVSVFVVLKDSGIGA